MNSPCWLQTWCYLLEYWFDNFLLHCPCFFENMENSCSFSESADWLMLCPIEATLHFYKHLSCTLPVSKVVVCVVLANSWESSVIWSAGCTDAASGYVLNAGGWGSALSYCALKKLKGQHVGRLLHNAAKLQHLRNIKPAFVWKCLSEMPKLHFWEVAIRPEHPEYKLLSNCISLHLSVLNFICPFVS